MKVFVEIQRNLVSHFWAGIKMVRLNEKMGKWALSQENGVSYGISEGFFVNFVVDSKSLRIWSFVFIRYVFVVEV